MRENDESPQMVRIFITDINGRRACMTFRSVEDWLPLDAADVGMVPQVRTVDEIQLFSEDASSAYRQWASHVRVSIYD